jgi:hypothetical protein
MFFIAFAVFDQVDRPGYSEFEVGTDATDLKLETNVADLEVEMDASAL